MNTGRIGLCTGERAFGEERRNGGIRRIGLEGIGKDEMVQDDLFKARENIGLEGSSVGWVNK